MKILMGGKWCEASDGRRRNVINPSTGEAIDSVPLATAEDVENSLKAADAGKTVMRGLSSYQRYQMLKRSSELIWENQTELAALLARENGKPLRQTSEEIQCTAYIFEGFAEEAKRIIGEVIPMDAQPGNERHFSYTVRQPIGVVAAIVPFNYPVELFAHKAAPALAAGNALIVKPPEACPLTLLRIAELMLAAGVPADGFQMITGPGSVVGEALASSPVVDLITITASTRTGQRVSELAAQTIKRVTMELGGNDVSVVFADADLEKAAEAVVLGRLARGNGQICCAVKRVLIQEEVREQFTQLLLRRASQLTVGDALDPATDVGPLIHETAAKEVEEIVNRTIAQGARVLLGASRNGNFYSPTVLSAVTREMAVFREEVFGPVVPLIGFRTEAEALQLANDSAYGLQAGIFTRDISRAIDFAMRLQAGGVVVNWTGALRAANLPFGGVKLSGKGREGIHHTIEEMTELKSVIFHNVFPSA
ncbi:lactaldehyde dehydrogenase [Hydrogenispora ethanolica]|uniref:3-sulfolactaldehyde dehydrogenase n=1 Tax=Hydrogenispora ethanolica TaxID=1082276 RepID=A0A4R1RAG6_HYDET|nr:aldehyde dehydrogenase family protein [Hydrogenispora ethanolica]TCL62754.1 lactaldehyde dehydrogenase [Hydrogenispora ethanolica]